MSPPAAFPTRRSIKMAKLGYVIDDWMKHDRREDQRRAVLDLDGRIFRRRALHHHEHDEQQSAARRPAKWMCAAR